METKVEKKNDKLLATYNCTIVHTNKQSHGRAILSEDKWNPKMLHWYDIVVAVMSYQLSMANRCRTIPCAINKRIMTWYEPKSKRSKLNQQ